MEERFGKRLEEPSDYSVHDDYLKWNNGGRFYGDFKYIHVDRCMAEMCPYCKNEDTYEETFRPKFVLNIQPYKEWYGGMNFKAMSCSCCDAIWHFPFERKKRGEKMV